MKKHVVTESEGAWKSYTFEDIYGASYDLLIGGEFYTLQTSALRISGPEKDLIISYDNDSELDHPCTLEAWPGDFRVTITPESYEFLVNNTNISKTDNYVV